MSNHLGMAMIHAILTLHQRGWSKRRIARELGVDRGAVDRHLAAAAAAQANPPPGSDTGIPGTLTGVEGAAEGPKPATNPPLGSGAVLPATASAATGPASDCEPCRAAIEEKLSQGLSGQRIYQDLMVEQGDGAPSYDSIKRFLRHLRQSTPVPFRRMEVAPGQEAQVDFGSGVPIVGTDGKGRRRTHVFRFVLSHSRKGYSEVV